MSSLLHLLRFLHQGLSYEEIAKMIVQDAKILHSSVPNMTIPSLSILKGLLGSNNEVARLLRKCAWFITTDFEKILMPNVEILKSRGIPIERVLHFVYTYPRCFLIKPDIVRKYVDKAIEFGVPLTSIVFIHAVGVFANTSQGMCDVKLQIFRDLGFSDDEIFSIFRSQPLILGQSQQKLNNVLELLLGKGKYSFSDIVANPPSLGCSIEKRLEPRLQILGLLESRNLIIKRPRLSSIVSPTDDRFFDKFVKPYYNEIGEEYIKIYGKGKRK